MYSEILKAIISFAFSRGPMCLGFSRSGFPLSRHLRIPGLPCKACRRSCTSMFANRPDKATAVRQTQNTNINKQTNPFIHSTPLKHCMHTKPDSKALTQPAVRALCLPEAALFGSYPVHFCDLVSLLIDGVRESLASLSDKALA